MPYIKLLTVLAGLALLTACGGSATPKTDNTGEPAVSCDTNPYGADCGTGFETQRLNIVSECRTDDSGDFCNDAITFFCDETTIRDLLCRETKAYKDLIAMEQNECLTRTGSQTACDEEARVKNCEASAFSTNCADTKYVMQRESMCLADIMIDDSCRGTTGIATLFCEANPFNTATACMHGDYADERQTMCLANIMIDDSCRGEMGIATVFCEADPFNTATACMADAYNDERLTECTGDITTPRCMQIVTPVCEANNGFNNPVCRGIEKYDEQLRCAGIPACADGVITHADWVEGFDDTPNTAGDYTRQEAHEFLQGTPNGLDVGTVKDFGSPSTVVTLNLKSLKGDAKNGVAWFYGGDGVNGNLAPVRLYAGILSGTDLGAPLTSADVSVSVPWAGKFGWRFFNRASASTGFSSNELDFDLTVDFDNSEIRAFVARGGAPVGNTDHFLLKAEFDDRGRFDGTINHGTFAGNDKTATPTNVTTGVLTGLIGKQGAVGAFISNRADIATTNTSFVGGFVAISPKEVARIEAERLEEAQELLESQVTYTDWIGGFGVSPPPATPTSPATNQFLANPATAPTTLTNTIGGVGFFTANGAYYAGLLSNTNVGLPVEITPQANSADVTANWPGKIRAIQVFDGNSGSGDTQTALDLNVVVNLTARTFTATRRDPNSNSTTITINGLFPATNNGVVTGTVTQRAGLFTRNGQLTGIIGQDGVVGAFYSDSDVATEHRYVGGFYAAPQ